MPVNERRQAPYRNRNLLIVFAVTLVAVQGVSGITPALPKIVRTLGVTPQQVGLLVTSTRYLERC